MIFCALSRRYTERYLQNVGIDIFEAIAQIVTDPHGAKVGGTSESPWSDETWLKWLRNRVADLERQPIDEVRLRFVKAPKPRLDSTDRWSEFLQDYSKLAAKVGEIEGWNGSAESPSGWIGFPPATVDELTMAESRLGVVFPLTLRTFFLTTNGWRADGWVHPQIHRLADLNWLRETDPRLYSLAKESELTAGPFNRDPGGSRLAEFRMDFGSRVLRSIALNRDTNDTGTALMDPFTTSEEWPCGVWAHWHTDSPWSYDSFSSYMYSRYEFLLDIERDA